jgi:uncharacterized protein
MRPAPARGCNDSGMPRRPLAAAAVLVLALLLAACGSDEPTGGTGATATVGGLFERGTVRIDTGEETVTVPVEIAETPSQREQGLMHREELPADEGMVFLFDEEQTSGFWMKNTLIPLSIAFYDTDGVIVRILDMEPCAADPCTVYEPGAPYRGALEVNAGAFRRWGVEAGDRVTLDRAR